MKNAVTSYLVSVCLRVLTISGGQFVIFTVLSILDNYLAIRTRQPIWYNDTLSIQDRLNSLMGYLFAFSFFAFWGLTLVFILGKIVSLIPKRQLLDRLINGLLTFMMALIISIGLGYHASLDNLSILLTSMLGLLFGSTILTQQVRSDGTA